MYTHINSAATAGRNHFCGQFHIPDRSTTS